MLPIYLNNGPSYCPSSSTRRTQRDLQESEYSLCPKEQEEVFTDRVPSKNTNMVKPAADVTTASHSRWNERSQSLDADFVPGPFDIICARGKVAWNHSGNKRFRTVVKVFTQTYAQAKNKTERSIVVSDILNVVRAQEGTGLFVKKERDGQWITVDNLLAREKVGQMLRNALSSKYRSSVICKKRRRKENQIKSVASLHGVMQSNRHVRQSMDALQQIAIEKKKENPNTISDDELMAMFVQEQSNMLAHIKADEDGLVDRFLQAEVMACLTLNFDDDHSSTSSDSDSDGDVEMTIV